MPETAVGKPAAVHAEQARIIVQKYGGSSVADVEKIRQVAAQIAATRRQGIQVVAVVSAMGKTTDQLMNLAHEVTATPDRRELDMLLSAGERIAMALLAMAVRDQGFAATSLTGSQCGILTNDSAGNARIVEIRPFRVQDALEQGHVVIVAGFQGTSWRREVTTLGRGGSDTTAVALAAALGADCEIYSDVDGIYTADPRIVAAARRVNTLSYDETLALSRAGAKVLAADAVALARMHGIALYARKTGGGGGETVVRLDAARDATWLTGVAGRAQAVVIEVVDAQCAAVQDILSAHNICEIARVSTPISTIYVVGREVADGVDPAFERAIDALKDMSTGDDPAVRCHFGALASIVGPAVGRDIQLPAQFRQVVANCCGGAPSCVLVHGVTLSALVPAATLNACLTALHQQFIDGQRGA
ncbi:MAG: aspartate kinase [Myxococcales bacterium]|nr:aspartate kinase [Myxococcales bacterium]